jgi:predicted DNA-binding protein (UPF0251 family)
MEQAQKVKGQELVAEWDHVKKKNKESKAQNLKIKKMPRPRKRRNLSAEAEVTYFKPAGIRKCELEIVEIFEDEYEALKLKDLDNLEQAECALRMQISQPTFHRLLNGARKKIAEGIIKGKAIKIKK